MQTHLENWISAEGSKTESMFGPEVTATLLENIQALLVPYGAKEETVSTAFNEVLVEINIHEIGSSLEEFRSYILGLIVWKIFAPEHAVWINPLTMGGNKVPLDLLVAAYSVWNKALRLAEKMGVDDATAAEALVLVTHAVVDRIIRDEKCKRIGAVRDARRYMYIAFRYLVSRIAAKQCADRITYMDFEKLLYPSEFCDQGAFMETMESGILCWELINTLSRRTRSISIARYILGYSWEETAEALGTSVDAAEKALSSGIRNALGHCTRRLRKMGYHRIYEFDSCLLEHKKKRHFKRRSQEIHGCR